MTLPGSNLSLNQVNTELGRSATATIELNDAAVRSLAGVGGSGTTFGMNSLLNKTHSFTFSAQGANLNLRDAAIAAGWDGVAVLKMVNIGNIYSNSTGTAALTINGSFPRGVTLQQASGVYGRGGDGGPGSGPNPIDSQPAANYGSGAAGGGGGTAIAVSVPVTIQHQGVTSGGGGGGGGGGTGKCSRIDPAYGTLGAHSCSAAGGGGGSGYGLGSGGGGGGGTNYNSTYPHSAPGHNYAAGAGTGSSLGGPPGSGGNHAAIGHVEPGYGTLVSAAVGGHGGTGGLFASAGAGGGTGYIGGNSAGRSDLSSAGGGGGGGGSAFTGVSLVTFSQKTGLIYGAEN